MKLIKCIAIFLFCGTCSGTTIKSLKKLEQEISKISKDIYEKKNDIKEVNKNLAKIDKKIQTSNKDILELENKIIEFTKILFIQNKIKNKYQIIDRKSEIIQKYANNQLRTTRQQIEQTRSSNKASYLKKNIAKSQLLKDVEKLSKQEKSLKKKYSIRKKMHIANLKKNTLAKLPSNKKTRVLSLKQYNKPLKYNKSIKHHNGVVYSSELGKRVNSIGDGKVIYSDWLKGYGNILIIDHNNGMLAVYGHNETNLVKSGDKVSRGQQIAKVGISGGFGKPGLYFEVRKNGKLVPSIKWN